MFEKLAIGLKKLLRSVVTDPSPFCSAIITAAGSGTRMGGVSKQLLPLCGKEAVLYSLEAFQGCSLVSQIVISAKEEEIDAFHKLIEKQYYSVPVTVVKGGASRQESIANAFYAVDKKAKYVAIHDAARPLLQSKDVELLFHEAIRYQGATAASKVADSMKRADENGMISSDVDREDLWAVQTPQVFSCDVYRVALALAQKDRFTVTDDNSLVTHAGFPVKLVDLHNPNYKLTTTHDVELVETILKARMKNEN